MRKTWVASLLVMVACSEEAFPPVFYESPNFFYPIAVNDSALYYVETDHEYERRLAELGLDGVERGRVSPMIYVSDVKVRGSTIEWLAGHELARSGPTGMETVTLPAGFSFHFIELGPTGTFVTGMARDAVTATIFFWGPNGLLQVPIEPMVMRLVGADTTHVYVVKAGGMLARYPVAGGVEESLAIDVNNAVVSEDRLIYSTRTVLVERSLVDNTERVLHTRPSNAQPLWPLVVAGDVVFWGNMRVMDGKIEEFLLPSSSGNLWAVVANSSDVYWVSTQTGIPTSTFEPSNLRLHRAPIRGARPF
jgi:hypothetical protein